MSVLWGRREAIKTLGAASLDRRGRPRPRRHLISVAARRLRPVASSARPGPSAGCRTGGVEGSRMVPTARGPGAGTPGPRFGPFLPPWCEGSTTQ